MHNIFLNTIDKQEEINNNFQNNNANDLIKFNIDNIVDTSLTINSKKYNLLYVNITNEKIDLSKYKNNENILKFVLPNYMNNNGESFIDIYSSYVDNKFLIPVFTGINNSMKLSYE